MLRAEKAKRWILSHCSETDEVGDVDFSETDLPDGVSLSLLKAVFGELKQAGRIAGGIATPDNTLFRMRLKCLD